MTKDFDKEFNKEFEKEVNNKIENPRDLKEIVASSIKMGERKLLIKNTIKTSKVIISIFILFIISINLFPSLSTIASNLPIIGRLAEVMTFDKGIKNAVEEGLYQDIGYSETKNGITLKVKNVAGDYRILYFEIEIESDDELYFDVRVKSKDKNDIEYMLSNGNYYSNKEAEKGDFSVKLKFLEFIKEFILVVEIKDDLKGNVIEEFEVEINLDEKFNKGVNEIGTENKNIKTEVGEIKIKSLDSSTTRTSLEFEFLSEEYDFIMFDNVILIDEMGEVYKSANMYSSMNNENFNIEFEGDLSKKKELTFKSDGIYFARKDNRILILDLENLKLEDNDYNIRLLTDKEIEENGLDNQVSENTVVLASKETMGFYIKLNDNINFISSSFHSIDVNEKSYEEIKSQSEFFTVLEISTDEKIIELEIENIYRDRTSTIEFKLK